ncbi:MAG: hypothetical protein GY802_30340, partial [Gammaproteobacteria bacterium]|nr:hypothetical protein [Gammaproteobacteria bacterium]
SVTVAEGASNTALTTGDLSSTDADTDDTTLIYTVGDVTNGTLTINGSAWASGTNDAFTQQDIVDGNVLYTHDGTNTTSDGFSYTVEDPTGNTLAGQTFGITVTPVNDAPVIGGIDTGAVIEDTAVVDGDIGCSGSLTIADPDVGESSFQAATVTGAYGDLTIDAAGNWSYSANNARGAIQALDAGESLIDTLTVSAFDGTTHDVVITINGAEDAAVIGGTTTGAVTEDGTLTASDTLTITDADTSDNPVGFGDVAATPGDNGYGDFEITGNTWTYTLNNGHAAIQALGAGETLNDSYTFTAGDGSSQTVTITIDGAGDAPVIGGLDSGSVTEDRVDNAGMLSDTGVLTITDVDAGDSYFVAGTVNGKYGSLSIDGEGNWRYSADNGQSGIQALRADETVTDILTVISGDGTGHRVVITINGVAEAAPPVVVVTPPVDETIPEEEVTEPGEVEVQEQAPDEQGVLDEEIIRAPQGDRLPATASGAEPDFPETRRNQAIKIDHGSIQESAKAGFADQKLSAPLPDHGLDLERLTLQVSDSEELNQDFEQALLERITRMHKEIDGSADVQDVEAVEVQIVLGSTVSLTAGIVSWVLRGGSLMASLMGTMPLLNRFDPLPILKGSDDKEKVNSDSGDDDDDDDNGDDDTDKVARNHARRVDNMFSGNAAENGRANP